MRQVVLDTETTGLEPSQGHRIIEIGCVEMINRRLTGRHYHQYINPEREIDQGAIEVHGISNEFLADKPVFSQIADDFMAFIKGAELVIHNAPFDIGFIDYELALHGGQYTRTCDYCSIIDSLVLARDKYPGQKNNLDALCKRHGVDNSHRDLHGALLDAEILADVYLLMTGGQTSLLLNAENEQDGQAGGETMLRSSASINTENLIVIPASAEEEEAHKQFLDLLDKKSGQATLWRQVDSMV